MNCYLCHESIPEDHSFYRDHEQYVCKTCFKDAPRCFICRFPGKQLETVEGLGLECEFCRGKMVSEGDNLEELIDPVMPFITSFGLAPPEALRFSWLSLKELRAIQTNADLPPESFIDDFLRYCYPVFYQEGTFHCLKRMTKPTFVVYTIVQLAVADIARSNGLPHLRGQSPFHTFARGYCHFIGFEAARRLEYDLEWRQLRKWPELGAQGEFERWRNMTRFNSGQKMIAYFQANLGKLARSYLGQDDEET